VVVGGVDGGGNCSIQVELALLDGGGAAEAIALGLDIGGDAVVVVDGCLGASVVVGVEGEKTGFAGLFGGAIEFAVPFAGGEATGGGVGVLGSFLRQCAELPAHVVHASCDVIGIIDLLMGCGGGNSAEVEAGGLVADRIVMASEEGFALASAADAGDLFGDEV